MLTYCIDFAFFKLLDYYFSPQVHSTAGFYFDPPSVPFQSEPINYSTSDSSSSSPPQSGWIAAQEVTQPNDSNGFQPDQQEQPQQQDYSSYCWNNWEYSPPFYSSYVSHPNFYSNSDPSSCYYYPPETTNPFYYQSCNM